MEKLVDLLKQFPILLRVRPIIVDENGIIVAGNMRYQALVKMGYSEIDDTWVQYAYNFTKDELRELILKDNVNYGEWDFAMLNAEFPEFASWINEDAGSAGTGNVDALAMRIHIYEFKHECSEEQKEIAHQTIMAAGGYNEETIRELLSL